MARMMTPEQWKMEEENDKKIKEHLERTEQLLFAIEQEKESVFTRPTDSIVDADNQHLIQQDREQKKGAK